MDDQISDLELLPTDKDTRLDPIEVRNLELKRLSLTDPLTGLGNRRLWEQEVQEAANGNKPFAVLIVDIDHFKRINDACGHQTGDKFLVALANKIKTLIREHRESPDIAARYGGDELALLLRGVDLETAKMIAERLRKDIEEETIPFNGNQAKTTISIGLTEGLGKDPEQIMREADQALYRAKEAGRNCVEVATNEELTNRNRISGQTSKSLH